jgi:hypothetical protein
MPALRSKCVSRLAITIGHLKLDVEAADERQLSDWFAALRESQQKHSLDAYIDDISVVLASKAKVILQALMGDYNMDKKLIYASDSGLMLSNEQKAKVLEYSM